MHQLNSIADLLNGVQLLQTMSMMLSTTLINAPALTVLTNDPLPIVVTHNGSITAPSDTYEGNTWAILQHVPLIGTPTAKNTVVTFPTAEGVLYITDFNYVVS